MGYSFSSLVCTYDRCKDNASHVKNPDLYRLLVFLDITHPT